MDKVQAIADLNRLLRHPIELGGEFLPLPPRSYPPRFDLMFVAEMPGNPRLGFGQARNFAVTARDAFLQDMMIKYGVAGCYVTDIVKRRDVPRRPTRAEVLRWLPFFLREIAIIQPHTLIVLGKRTYEATFRPYVAAHIPLNLRVAYVFHYSSQVPREKFEQRFASIVDSVLSTVHI